MFLLALILYFTFVGFLIYLGYLLFSFIKARIIKLDNYRKHQLNLLNDISKDLALYISISKERD